MNLLVRLLKVWIAARFRPRLPPIGTSVLRFRTWPNDLDTNLHMNNGRYLTLMDLGRLDLILRTGLWRVMRTQRWMPLVGAVVVRYKRSLQPLRTFRLSTHLLGWDGKWFYIEQRFERPDGLVAVGFVKALFRGRDGNVPPARAMAAAGHDQVATPVLPAALERWEALEAEMLSDQRERPGTPTFT